MIATSNSKRQYLPQQIELDKWEMLEPFFTELAVREIVSKTTLEKWLKDWSEVSEALEEFQMKLYIAITVDTGSADKAQAYGNFVSAVAGNISSYENKFQKKLLSSPHLPELNQPDFFPTLRKMKNDIVIFRQENIELLGKEQMLQNKFNEIRGKQKFEFEGKEYSLEGAATLLKSKNREVRKQVYEKVQELLLKDSSVLDELLTELIDLRNQIALNAGFKNYIDYKYAEWGRFDYSLTQANELFETIANTVTPMAAELSEQRKKALGLDRLSPWDLQVELTDRPPISPSVSSEDLLEKVIKCLRHINPFFGEQIERMKQLNHFDLDSRQGKMKGAAYNADLPETGVPFIMNNNTNSAGDLTAMIHESGHAIHSMLQANLEYTWFKQSPLEIKEVASKAMELISMKYWDIFYQDARDLKQAKKMKLEEILIYLSQVYARSEAFQNWLYLNPGHTIAQRRKQWLELTKKFDKGDVDGTGYEESRSIFYQNILPVYILPFYMIAYCFSDLGAISIWRNFAKDPDRTIAQYKTALSLGNKRNISELYEAGGIKFEFTEVYVKELMDFVKEEMNVLA